MYERCSYRVVKKCMHSPIAIANARRDGLADSRTLSSPRKRPGVGHICWQLFFFDECAFGLHRSCIVVSARSRSSSAHRFDAQLASAAYAFYLQMHTKISEGNPLKIEREMLARARSVAALAPPPKPGRKFKKSVVKNSLIFRAKICHAFLARSWRHCGIPTQNPKIYQKSMVKIDIRFRAQNRHGKITKKSKNQTKKMARPYTVSPTFPTRKNRCSRGRI